MLDKRYWTNRYENDETQWDIGYASPALMAYMEGKPFDSKILIPGAGNAYEAEELWKRGFKNITVLDISELPLTQLKNRVPDFPSEHLICEDFFLHEKKYDIILEQTFFCALHPELRSAYVKKMSELLLPEAELAGLLFASPMNADRPPFGGSKDEYLDLFSAYLIVLEMDVSKLSIPPRAGNEFFFKATSKM